MIALTIFALFVTAFMSSQGYNVADSTLSEEQLTLQLLAERKVNELVLDPPKFQNITGSGLKETKTFESPWGGYEYTLEIKKLEIPDFGQLFTGQGNSSEQGSDNADYFSEGNRARRDVNIERMIFTEMKRNIERILWQARVTVTNKETKFSFALSTYLTNYNERVQLNVGF
jgi:hypothetical protein